MNRAESYRKRRAQASEPTAELTLPSGEVFTVRRPPLQVWVAAGKIPQSFLRKMGGDAGAISAAQLSDAETLAAIEFVRDAIVYACVSPKLVIGGTGEDELDPSELDPADFEFLTGWIMQGCPGVPVRTKEGETSIEALDRFRQKRPGGGTVGAGDNSDEVSDEAVAAAAPV